MQNTKGKVVQESVTGGFWGEEGRPRRRNWEIEQDDPETVEEMLKNIQDEQVKKEYEISITLCVGDVISERFKKVFDDRGLSVEKEAKKLGYPFWQHDWKVERHKDGTETYIARNNLKLYLDGDLQMVFKKDDILHLEQHLGLPKFEIVTYAMPSDFKPIGLTEKEFLYACDYLELDEFANFVPSKKFYQSPRVKAYLKGQQQRMEEELDRKRAAIKAQMEQRQREVEERIRKLKAHALGKWQNSNHNYGR